MITVDKIIKKFRHELKDIYPLSEINAFLEIALEFYLKFSKIDLITKINEEIEVSDYKLINDLIDRLKLCEPIQYILGETDFFGLKFNVDENVLIPRQETEELVDWIIKENKSIVGPKILDIGTGSGCISVSLAANIKKSFVDAIDVSEPALNIAVENSLKNSAKINPILFDILKFDILDYNFPQYDIIVSNPPYVRESEKQLMQKNVLDFEPYLALFVEEDNALIFYEKILKFSKRFLKPDGKLYFEINETYGNEMIKLYEHFSYKDINLRNDINGKYRMICGTNLK